MRWIVVFSLTFSFHLLFSQQVHIGLLRQFSIKQVTFSPSQDNYVVKVDSQYVDTLVPGETIKVSLASNNQLKITKGDRVIGTFSTLALVSLKANSNLKVLSISPAVRERKYRDNFTVFNAGDRLTVINDVSMQHYLDGVVESEGGGNKPEEYYKVQAIISRTYAVKNVNRHQKEGFQLCDGVHCQAYQSMLRFTPEIEGAVKGTKSLVLTDSTGKLIDAFYHANCGGQTSESEYVWNQSLSYIHSFIDTFCVHTSQSTWVKRIPQADWKSYLVKQYGYPIQDSNYASSIYNFTQNKRMPFYKDAILGIPLRDLRTKFNLKSTFFSCHPEGDQVVLNGRGYGHGIGLCQEGAMNMASHGFKYDQILKFYFSGAQLVLLENLHYFNQDVKSPFDF